MTGSASHESSIAGDHLHTIGHICLRKAMVSKISTLCTWLPIATTTH